MESRCVGSIYDPHVYGYILALLYLCRTRVALRLFLAGAKGGFIGADVYTLAPRGRGPLPGSYGVELLVTRPVTTILERPSESRRA